MSVTRSQIPQPDSVSYNLHTSAYTVKNILMHFHIDRGVPHFGNKSYGNRNVSPRLRYFISSNCYVKLICRLTTNSGSHCNNFVKIKITQNCDWKCNYIFRTVNRQVVRPVENVLLLNINQTCILGEWEDNIFDINLGPVQFLVKLQLSKFTFYLPFVPISAIWIALLKLSKNQQWILTNNYVNAHSHRNEMNERTLFNEM